MSLASTSPNSLLLKTMQHVRTCACVTSVHGVRAVGLREKERGGQTERTGAKGNGRKVAFVSLGVCKLWQSSTPLCLVLPRPVLPPVPLEWEV